MRDFLFSDIAAVHGLLNAPDDADLAIAAGRQLCEQLLEPLQRVFGRIAIRSAYRSAEVNALGCQKQKEKLKGYNCSSNEANYAGHIWDRRDADGCMGATACIVIPEFVDAFPGKGEWTKLAWWIHDTLPYSSLEFFPTNWAFNINWRDKPKRQIYSYAGWRNAEVWKRNGYLVREGETDDAADHSDRWKPLAEKFSLQLAHEIIR
ncbi:hypothetical protein [Sphingomonas sp. YL-JM2C]